MSVRTVCPHCETTVELPDDVGDQLGECPNCGNFIVAPPSEAQIAARSKRTWWSTLNGCISIALKCFWILLFGGIVALMFVPISRPYKEAARRIHCTNNLKQLGLAIHNYATANKCFPPAYVADRNGKLVYSWRALMLPYFEDCTLGKRFHYDEPWNSEANRKLWKEGKKYFQCPTAEHASDDCTTDYMMVVGPHTFSDGPHGRTFREITDGLSNTIMTAEVADSGVNWAEPKDLEFDRMDFKINGRRPCIGSHHSNGANIGIGDGSVRFLSNSLPAETLKAAITIDDGEKVDFDN
jgi:hypothetical protein